MRLVWLAFLSACTFNPPVSISGDGAPGDSSPGDAHSDGPPGSDAPMADASPPPQCPADYVRVGQLLSRYKIYGWSRDTRGLSFFEAAKLCADSKTHLAIIDSAQEASALGAAIAVSPRSPYFWNGLTDAATENVWLTVTGAAPLYLPWAQGQPDGGTQANCALAADGKIYDWTCGSRFPFACECDNP